MNAPHSIQPDTAPRPHRFTKCDFMALVDAGAFAREKKAELIEGVIVTVNAQFSRHVRAHSKMYRLLATACDRLTIPLEAWIEGSVQMAGDSMPQPDIIVTTSIPEAGPIPVTSVVLVVEIADQSLAFDRRDKAALYAREGIPEYWIVDVNRRTIECRFGISPDGYSQCRPFAFGEPLAAATIQGLTIDTDGL